MGEEIAFENGRISDLQGLLTFTLDRVIQSKLFVDGRTDIWDPFYYVDSEEST